MIGELFSPSPNLQVLAASRPFSISGVNSGQLRYNTQTNCVEVSCGDIWQRFSGVTSISLSPEVDTVLAWAKQEMMKSHRIAEAAAKSVTVADALATFNDAAEKLQIIMALAEKES